MPSVTIKTIAGKEAGTAELAADVFGVQPNVPVMHQAVIAQLAHRRSGTQSTKTRAEVRGGGRKPFKQKGTGNARQGSIRAPHYSGGGITHAPKPRSYTMKVNKKVVRLALTSALSDRANEGKVLVVESWGWDAPSTKSAVSALKALGIDSRALVVLQRDDVVAAKSFRNLPGIQILEANELNAYDVLCNDWLVFTAASLPRGTGAAPKAVKAAANAAAPTAKAAAPTAKAEVAEVDSVAEVAPIEAAAPAEAVEVEVAAPVEQAAAPQAFAAVGADADTDTDSAPIDFGPGSAPANADGSGPEAYTIKGNADSMLYHLPDGRWYDATIAEVWFDTEAAAVAAGFTKAGARKAKAADAEDAE